MFLIPKKRAHEQSTAIEDVRKRYFHNEGQPFPANLAVNVV